MWRTLSWQDRAYFCEVVDLRFFGCPSVQETAEVLKTSKETVERDWSLAKLWHLREMNGGAADGA
jgi:hypothetical protein